MDINALSRIGGVQPQIQPKTYSVDEVSKSFSSFLSDAMTQVNQAQLESADLTAKFAAGQIQDIHQVTIAGQKSSVMLQLTMQVRNKVIESYQEIMRMPL
ncbi:flagellar hook-basal body complex protein FliE [Brevibacillus composti]|uniref:Flagellar hook-basal body complex protein FliE n=1 Tax=Brevibacillus composti TaxID=2796470 RepID=A0A7T5JQH0_9BACL|nr:flagellar hook-basal body complex protein FliE [Brevibacillus composti]QQE76126.1 flagellar hook-basal body complex protein FliE [Brevibacillus composti]QUO43155.1 flagellar hook-basal body complex protein FliE [Brevibacillus composti]